MRDVLDVLRYTNYWIRYGLAVLALLSIVGGVLRG
jgi:hypothetical protein